MLLMYCNHELVAIHQKHTYSRTCRKYRNIQCSFNFGQFFTDRTIVAQLVSEDLCEEVKTGILIRRASYYSWHYDSDQ